MDQRQFSVGIPHQRNLLQYSLNLISNITTKYDLSVVLAIAFTIYIIVVTVWIWKYIKPKLYLNLSVNLGYCPEEIVVLLHNSIKENEITSSLSILKKYPSSINTYLKLDGYTPLLRSASHGNTQLVKYLLSNGADISAKTTRGENAFYLAIYNRIQNRDSRDATCIHALFHAGIDINTPTCKGYNALQISVMFGHKSLILWLLAKNADINIVPHPYLLAKSQGHVEIAKLFKEDYEENYC